MKGDKAEYVIPLRQAFNTPRSRRADKAIFLIREFVKKHTRANAKDIAISNEVNEFVWKQSKFTIPRRVDAVLKKDGSRVTVFIKGGKEIEAVKAKAEEKEKKGKKEAKPKKEDGKAEKTEKDGKSEKKGEEKKPDAKEAEQKAKLEEKREKEKNAQKAEFK
ncbi:MAG: 50S ribosomal protein L31e [archaeon]